jgi:hypothetical protein
MNSASTNSQYSGGISDKGESGQLSYSRTKLVDVYRMTDMKSRQLLNGFVQVPLLTLEEPSEPLALCAPNPEELVNFYILIIWVDTSIALYLFDFLLPE